MKWSQLVCVALYVCTTTIEKKGCTVELNRTFELLIKARTLELLKKQVVEGVGFAIEAISRIAAIVASPSYLEGKAQHGTNEN